MLAIRGKEVRNTYRGQLWLNIPSGLLKLATDGIRRLLVLVAVLGGVNLAAAELALDSIEA